MNKLGILFLIGYMLNTLYADNIFISPKVALKMIDKKEIIFLSLDHDSLKIKKSQKVDISVLESRDILGDMPCSPFYVCANKVEEYFSDLGIKKKNTLIVYDNSYAIKSSVLFLVLESMGHKNIKILRGNLENIKKLDPNWKIYNNYVSKLKIKDLNQTKNENNSYNIIQKMNILQPHLLLQEDNNTNIFNLKSNYVVSEESVNYFIGKKEFKKIINLVRSKESNMTIIDACEMIDIVGNTNGSYRSGVKSLFWKELIDKKQKYLKSNNRLEKIINKLDLKKNEQYYVYCMAGAQKALYVTIILRELGYTNVKAFIGDWNTWIGDIYE